MSFFVQFLALERERIQKWVKMVKNWEKYIRGEKVNEINKINCKKFRLKPANKINKL